MRKVLFLLPFVLFIACAGKAEPAKQKVYTFAQPEIPFTITDSATRVEWIAINYLREVNVSDTAMLASPSIEQAFVDWLQILGYVDAPLAGRALSLFMARADTSALGRTATNKMLERYLYDPNSPMRNEDMYIVVLQNMLASNNLSPDEKIRPQAHLDMALKNRPGTLATDFTYTDIDGKTGSLHKIKAPFTLLFFNNPDCTACKEITATIASSPIAVDMIAKGRIKVLGMYTDEDVKAWQNYAPNFPREWINGRNYDLHSSQQYDLKAIPTLYLLDKDKRVILKDFNINELLFRLESL